MDLSSLRILIVEDDLVVAATVLAMLHEMGVRPELVQESRDGAEALRYFEAHQKTIDLVICDWNMPKKTGIEFLREVRQVSPELPFLMITARADVDSIMAAKQVAVTAYIRKPFDAGELKQKIETIFAHKSFI